MVFDARFCLRDAIYGSSLTRRCRWANSCEWLSRLQWFRRRGERRYLSKNGL